MKRPHCLLLVGVLVILSAAPVLAQRSTATLRGIVTDATQSILPGVTVTVTNTETGLVRTTITNESGIYYVPELPVGRYTVAATLSGFKVASRTGVILRVADEFALDFTLQPGDVKEIVTVEASSTPVKLVGGEVSGVITGEMVRELPLNGRNFLQLATLMPGVSAPDFLNVKDKGLLGGSDLSVSGSDVTANLWTVDGANNNDVGSNRTLLVYPSLEAIEEFKILRNSYGPEFGGAGGAQINIVTRGGTNQFRGSLFYSGRDQRLNAKNYFLEKADQPKEELSRRDFGGSIGGPIIKDKLHFFGNLEWNLEDRGTARTAFVPTEAERRGDFSGAQIAGCSSPIPVDPLTGAPFPGNRIPPERLSPGGMSFLNLYPLPNVTPGAGSCNNWVTSVTSPIDFVQQSGRADWTITDASRLMVRYTHDKWENNAPSINANLWGDDPFPAVDSNWDQPSHSFVASLNQTLGNTANNSLQFSYSANKIDITRGGLNADLNSEILSRIQPILGFNRKQSRRGHRASCFLGRRGLPGALERGPLPQQPGPVHRQGRLHAGFRKAFHEGRRARQHESQERGHDRQRLRSAFAFLGGRRAAGKQLRIDRKRPRQFPLEGYVDRLLRSVSGPECPAAVERHRDVCRGLVAAFEEPDRGFRRALLALPEPVCGRQPDHELRPVPLQSGARQRPV